MRDPRFDRIRIEAFRGLTGVDLSGLTRVNLIVGANNTGKTTVLEAIQLLCEPLSMRTLMASARGRTQNELGEGRLESFRWMFPNGVVDDALVRIVGTGRELSLDVELRAQEAQELVSPRRDGEKWIPVLTLHPIARLAGRLHERTFTLRETGTLRERKDPEPFVRCQAVSPVAHRTASIDAAFGETFRQKGLAEVFDVVRCLDPSITDIRKIPVDGVQSFYVDRTGLPPAPLNTYGDGLRRVLTYAARIAQCQDGVLLIDEIETAIHFSALRRVYAWLVRMCVANNVQLIATTHSLEALDALLDATSEPWDTAFFRLYNIGSGPRVLRLSETELRTLREEYGDEVRG